MKSLLMVMASLLMMSGVWAADNEGQKPFDLTTLLGQTYKNCTIMKATPEALTIVHDNGVSKISFEQLSDEWKQKFNYDPARAKEFATAEDARRQEMEAKKKAMNEEREKQESENMAKLAEAENKRLKEEALRVKEQADAAKAAPMVGPPSVNQVTATTEAVVPAFTPISQTYSPGTSTSQRYIIHDGAGYYQSGYSSGYGYGSTYVYPPVYAYPYTGGYGYAPVAPIRRPPVAPVVRPHISGTIRVGNGVISINR